VILGSPPFSLKRDEGVLLPGSGSGRYTQSGALGILSLPVPGFYFLWVLKESKQNLKGAF